MLTPHKSGKRAVLGQLLPQHPQKITMVIHLTAVGITTVDYHDPQVVVWIRLVEEFLHGVLEEGGMMLGG